MKKIKLLMPLAGIAALGAIVPAIMLTSCNKTDSDKEFLDKINALMDDLTEQYVAPHTAIVTAKNNGYDVVNYALSKGEFAFDSEAKKFIIMDEEKILKKPANYEMKNKSLVFKFVNYFDDTESQTIEAKTEYGIYLTDYAASTWDSDKTLNIHSSIDTGSNTVVKKIKYTPTTTNGDSTKPVILRTTTDDLEIQGGSDKIYHMNTANNIRISGNGSDKCEFHETGTVLNLEITSAKIYAEKIGTQNPTIAAIKAIGNDVYADDSFDANAKVAYYSADGGEIHGTQKERKTPTTIGDIDTFVHGNQAWQQDTYIELSNSFAFNKSANEQQMKVAGNVVVWINLNGQTITDLAAASETEATSRIVISDGATLVITDSQNTGKIVLKDHNINVVGQYAPGIVTASTLYLNAVNIEYEQNYSSAPVVVGHKDATPTQYNSFLYVNGGTKITSNPAENATKRNAWGIFARTNGYVEINDAEIKTQASCVGGNGMYDNAQIDINGGSFESEELCIYQPHEGKINIRAGDFTGSSCLGIKAGTVDITGGFFHAIGTLKEMQGGLRDGIDTDGSVIVMDLLGQDFNYGNTPTISVRNAYLHSDKSYIFHGVGLENLADKVHGYMTFDQSGCYYYGSSESQPWILSNNVQGHLTLVDTGVTWNYDPVINN